MLQTLLTQCAGGSEPTAGSNFFNRFRGAAKQRCLFRLKMLFLHFSIGKWAKLLLMFGHRRTFGCDIDF